MKKSQLYGEIFVYVLTTVLISLILIYGYNAVHKFNERAELVSCLKFKNDLKKSIESIITDFGTVKKKEFELCSGYIKICFVESVSLDKSKVAASTDDPIIKDSISSDREENAFLVDGTAKEQFYVGKISVLDDPSDDKVVKCIKTINNKITLRLEGKGDHTKISEWK